MLKGFVIICLLSFSSIANAEEFYDKYYSNIAKLKNCEKIEIDERPIGGKRLSIKVCYWDIGNGKELWKIISLSSDQHFPPKNLGIINESSN